MRACVCCNARKNHQLTCSGSSLLLYSLCTAFARHAHSRRPPGERVYHLPLVSLTANASIIGGGDKQHVASIESVPSFATSVSADTSSATAANVGVNQDSCPYFPVSAAAFDQRTFCGQCFLLTYCSAECQRQHWHTSHHGACQRVRASFIAQYLHVHESLQSTAPNKQSKKKKKKLFTL